MGILTIACVRQGTVYGPEYVTRLRNMVARHVDREFRFVCLTDRPSELADGIEAIDIAGYGLKGWWAKMLLLNPYNRGAGRTVYFDLDTVICGPIDPLLDLDVDFGICSNFTRAVSPGYPCRYGSCVMTFARGWGERLFNAFWESRAQMISRCGSYGDQKAIEYLKPDAALLQDHMPPGFFLGRRDIAKTKPDGCSVVIFAGKSKPHNSPHQWIAEAWR